MIYGNEVRTKVRQLREHAMPVQQISEITKISKSSIRRWTQDIEIPYYNPRYKIECIDNDYFSPQNLKKYPERYIIIGFIAADGCISHQNVGQDRVCFNICRKDETSLNLINKEICRSGRKLSYIKKTNSLQLHIPSNQICKDLSKYNIIPRKTQTFQLPQLTGVKMAYFLRGYFYGDGCLSGKGSHQVCILLGTCNFITSLHSYLIDNNIINRAGVYPIHHSELYREIRIKNTEAAKFTEYIFFDDKLKLLPRKHLIIMPVIKGSRWTEKEQHLLQRLSITEFCNQTGRTIGAAQARLNLIRWPRK